MVNNVTIEYDEALMAGPAVIEFVKHKATYYPQMVIANADFFRP